MGMGAGLAAKEADLVFVVSELLSCRTRTSAIRKKPPNDEDLSK